MESADMTPNRAPRGKLAGLKFLFMVCCLVQGFRLRFAESAWITSLAADTRADAG